MSTGKNKERGSYFIGGLRDDQMKTYTVNISPTDARVKYIYEGNTDAKDGEDCLRTIYVYVGSSSTVLFSREVKDVWQAAFDVDALVQAQLATPPYTLE